MMVMHFDALFQSWTLRKIYDTHWVAAFGNGSWYCKFREVNHYRQRTPDL